MAIDKFLSRRDYHIRCQYWSRNENDSFQHETGINTQNSLIFNRVADGIFFAKIVSNQALEEQNVAGVFMFDKTSFTLKTPDKVKLKADDIIKIQGEIYFVDRVDKQIAKTQQTEYNSIKNVSYYTYINVRK